MKTRTALVIEDDRVISSLFSMALREAGFDTEAIQDGQTALEYLEHARPQLIIMDLNLPSASGRAILAFIRQKPHLAGSKVIIVSADSIQAAYLDDQGDLVLVKPVSVDQLRAASLRLFSDEGNQVGKLTAQHG